MSAAPKKWVVICCPVAGKKTAAAVTNDVFVPRMKEVIPDTLVEVIYTTHKVVRSIFPFLVTEVVRKLKILYLFVT